MCRRKAGCEHLTLAREHRLDSKSTVDDDKEELVAIADKSVKSIKVTPSFIELSKTLSCGMLDELIGQFDNYSGWKIINETEVEINPYIIKGYTKGNRDFRLTIQIASKDYKRILLLFEDPDKHTVWKNIARVTICSSIFF